MDPCEFDLTASDCDSSVGDWQVVRPSPKSLPLPSNFTRPQTPRIRSPFQVSDLASSSSSVTNVPQWTVPTSKPAGGLQRPVLREQEISSMRYPDFTQQSSRLEGLPAPQFSQPVLHSFLNQYHEVCLINNLVAVFALMTIQEVCNVSSRVRIQSSHGSRGCMCLRCQCFDILSVPQS